VPDVDTERVDENELGEAGTIESVWGISPGRVRVANVRERKIDNALTLYRRIIRAGLILPRDNSLTARSHRRLRILAGPDPDRAGILVVSFLGENAASPSQWRENGHGASHEPAPGKRSHKNDSLECVLLVRNESFR
jgi:hypothetical protein